MSANLEVKGTLAKLLATEDIVVEHRAVETAQFDVDNRVLTLPIWDASNNIIDVLVAHEVGHALYTPNVDPDCNAPQQFLNITEDVRIEKMMKRKYMGIAKSFYRGYKELNEMDFFELQDMDTYNLADKINLHFKIGAFLGIKFTPQEQVIVNVVEKSETFEDAIAAAEMGPREAAEIRQVLGQFPPDVLQEAAHFLRARRNYPFMSPTQPPGES